MRDSKKKCICRKCEDCQLYQPWDMTDQKTGLRKSEQKCGLQVLFEEIPFIRGSIDGCQQGANEARNRSMETKELIIDLAHGTMRGFEIVKTKIKTIQATNTILIED